ncbi:protein MICRORCHIDIA 6-like isoform X7 [Quercus lobata]|uniref:protein MICRORCHIDIA 6-like isoform X7 n=1 Tax=Quercus lobata TaxID=97700 RepID=UPI0012491F86|nr:protein MICRORCHIDIA 6-like isoform X7 [Quercus lobata]
MGTRALTKMNNSDIIDLCSDYEKGESNINDGQKELGSVVGTSWITQNFRIKEIQHLNKRGSKRKESEESRSLNAFGINNGNNIMVSSAVNQTSLSSAPICRQFWKAGKYERVKEKGLIVSNQNLKNHLHVHPLFLHSNATSHKWLFGAIAELIDNAFDEIPNGATFVLINKISNPRDSSPALLIQDDGGGIDPETMSHCMSFGFSDKKLKSTIGQYGNGFKTSSMRLGADVIIFSRQLKMGSSTQSVGLLSYTFLTQMGYDRIVVPMVTYEFNSSSGTFGPVISRGKEYFSSNLSMLLQWSPYSTEEELLKQFDDIGHHGTKIVVYNLWLNEEGYLELDFDSDTEAGDHGKPICDQHIANLYRYSLHAYLSILYMRLPSCFRIILRGQVVEHHSILSDLKFPEFIIYRPQLCGSKEVEVLTTIGFLKEAPGVNIHGFSIYNRNRLILPFWPAVKCTKYVGRGVVGVLEANFIEPTHNKQDFEKTSLFQRLEDRLRQMAHEYWSHFLQVSYLEHSVLVNHDFPLTDRPRAASSADGSSEDPVATTVHVSATAQRKSDVSCQAKFKQDSNIKRKGRYLPVELEHAKRHTQSEAYATDTWHNEEVQPENSIKNPPQVTQEMATLIRENEKLRLRLIESEKREEELYQKVQQLRSELKGVQHEYTKILVESKLIDMVEGANVKGLFY